MKRILVMAVVGLVMFGAGFGGGYIIGKATKTDGVVDGKIQPSDPGPVIPVDEFTSNLAGSGRRVINFSVALETINDPKAVEILSSDGWKSRIKNEILLIVKDKVYEDLTSSEGTLQFAEEIKKSLNAQLPEIKGEPLIARVLFNNLVLQ